MPRRAPPDELFPDQRPFRSRLRRWFERAGRDLPWRRTRDPYAILVSEFMLQQTQVATVIPYYERWLARFPDFAALARAYGWRAETLDTTAAFEPAFAAALSAAYPDQTWEVSHIGGDRYAGNALVLPDGLYLGRLDADSAVAAARAVEALFGAYADGGAISLRAHQADALQVGHGRAGPSAPRQRRRARAARSPGAGTAHAA